MVSESLWLVAETISVSNRSESVCTVAEVKTIDPQELVAVSLQHQLPLHMALDGNTGSTGLRESAYVL